jgi:hypothetical protein
LGNAEITRASSTAAIEERSQERLAAFYAANPAKVLIEGEFQSVNNKLYIILFSLIFTFFYFFLVLFSTEL